MPSPGQRPIKDPREETFVREYSRHGNRERAIIASGFNVKTWSKDKSFSGAVRASNLLKRDYIQQRLQWLQENRARKADFTELKLLRELRRIALFDIRKLYDEAGGLKPIAELDADTAAAITAVDVEKLFDTTPKGPRVHIGYTIKVKTADKIAAIDKLMKYFGMIDLPPEDPKTVVNVENQQVNFYLPENPRHAKTRTGQADEFSAERDIAAQPLSSGDIRLPAKRTNGSH